MRFENTRVIVTGAGTGIGRGIALAYAAAGATVAIHYSHSATGAEEAVAEIEASGGKAAAFQADFNEIDAVRKLSEDALTYLGGLDVLVNNAGITTNAPFEDIKPDQFDLLYHVNVRAAMFLTQYCLDARSKANPAPS